MREAYISVRVREIESVSEREACGSVSVND